VGEQIGFEELKGLLLRKNKGWSHQCKTYHSNGGEHKEGEVLLTSNEKGKLQNEGQGQAGVPLGEKWGGMEHVKGKEWDPETDQDNGGNGIVTMGTPLRGPVHLSQKGEKDGDQKSNLWVVNRINALCLSKEIKTIHTKRGKFPNPNRHTGTRKVNGEPQRRKGQAKEKTNR